VDAPVLLAVDGNSILHRCFHAQARTGHTVAGRPAWAVRGLLVQLVGAVDRIRPSAVVVGFDDPHRSVRRDQWPHYKAQRADKLGTLVEQLASAAAVLRALGLAVVVPDGLEADDVLASAALLARRHEASTVIVTSDRDAFALIDDRTSVLRIINGGVDASPVMTTDRLITLVGVRPDQYRDYAALRGDPSDNLPGVRGIGPRTAARLLAEFGTADAAFADPSAVRARLGAGVARRLSEPSARAIWERNCRVMAMRADVSLDLDLASGPGVLPLPAEQVRATFRTHDLVWTAADAVRVLAGVDDERPRPTLTPDAWPYQHWTPRRLPKLASRPAMVQPSLFD